MWGKCSFLKTEKQAGEYSFSQSNTVSKIFWRDFQKCVVCLLFYKYFSNVNFLLISLPYFVSKKNNYDPYICWLGQSLIHTGWRWGESPHPLLPWWAQAGGEGMFVCVWGAAVFSVILGIFHSTSSSPEVNCCPCQLCYTSSHPVCSLSYAESNQKNVCVFNVALMRTHKGMRQ